ncbi:MAG TPA: serine hydrolase domain-containing protein [Gemmatimonadales bacterium]|nr:serine hydrolase domain-containing protein [Gemmatimonadales bacterium]
MLRRLLLMVPGIAGTVAPLAAQTHDTLGLRPAFRLIDRYATRMMQRSNTPGLALALVDRAGVITVRTWGYADLDRRIPVSPSTRFEIGSISKSFTVISLLQLAESGKFDPAAPVTRYLPWFTPKTRWRPLTSHDLLTHTSGLPGDRDDVPSSPAQGYLARERTLGSAPGTYWAYSNIGYQVLGQILTKLDNRRYADIIRERILTPLGMTRTDAEFTHATRPSLAVGYEPLYDDRPERDGDPLVVAPWIEYGSGDGAIVSTAGDMGLYLTMLLNRGRGPGGVILPEARLATMMQPYALTERNGAHYGYGMFLDQLDGRPIFYHSGGMLGYTSMLMGEPSLGIGAVAFVNGPGSPGAVARFALRALGAAMRGDSLPELPDDQDGVEHAERYAGAFVSAEGDTLSFRASADTLFLVGGGTRQALIPYGEHSFLGPRERFPLFPLTFGGDSTGMTEVWYGERWYTSDRYRGPKSFAVPAAWKAYPGHYRIMQPWEPNFRVVLRKGALWYVSPTGGEQAMTPLPGGEFRVGDPDSAERLSFGNVVDGKALTANFSGMQYFRYFVE